MKITVPKEEWTEITLSEGIYNTIALWIKWAVLIWISSYVISHVFAESFIKYAPDVCKILK